MSVEQRAAALIALVSQDCATKRGALFAEAQAAKAKLLRDANARARVRIRDAFQVERAAAEQRMAAARARLNTRRRIALQQRERALLEAAWTALPDVLHARWQDRAERDAWIDQVVGTALAVLPIGAWTIAHPQHWPSDEAQQLRARLQPKGITPTFVVDAGIGAGLRITAGANIVDGTLAGLLAEREDLGARILYALENAR